MCYSPCQWMLIRDPDLPKFAKCIKSRKKWKQTFIFRLENYFIKFLERQEIADSSKTVTCLNCHFKKWHTFLKCDLFWRNLTETWLLFCVSSPTNFFWVFFICDRKEKKKKEKRKKETRANVTSNKMNCTFSFFHILTTHWWTLWEK